MNNTRYFILMVMLAIGITCNAATDIWTASAAGSSGNDNVTAYVKGTTNTTTEPFQGTASFYFNTGGNANGSWEGDRYYMYIAPAAFNSVELKAGQKIVLTLNYTQGDSKVYLRYPNSLPSNPEGWTLIKEESASGSTWTYALASDDVTNIKAHGLGIGGIYINFTKVSIADADESTDPPAPETVKGFHINGTHLVDAKGNDFLIRGYNYSYAWQSDWGFGPIAKAKEVGCNAIRLNIGNGNKFNYTDYNTLANLISYCEGQKLVCIPEVQDPLGSNSIDDLDKAVDYWLSMKNALIGHENTVIINIANEWVEGWEEQADTWRDGYVKAIKRLRAAGLKHTIMIDCAGYGQYPDVIWTHGQDIIDAEREANGGEVNIMFSIHFYEHACYEDYLTPSGSKVAAVMDKALAMNVPLCVGEFGYARKDGTSYGPWHCDYKTILEYGKTRNVGYLGWSHHGNGENDECLDMFYGDGSLTKNGDIIINTPDYGIKATSKECTVFNDTPDNSYTLPEYAKGEPTGDAAEELADVRYVKVSGSTLNGDELANAGLTAGRKLRVMFKENASATAYATVSINNGESSEAFVSDYNEEFAVAGFKYMDISVTASMLKKLDAGGTLTIGGKGFETEGIYVICPDIAYADGTIEKTEKGKDETSHPFENDKWDTDGSEHHIQGTDGNANSIFRNVQEGDIVEVTYTNVNSGAQMSIKDGARYKKDGNVYYSWINSSVDYMDVSGNGSYRFTVDKKAHAFTNYNAPTDNDGEDMVESLRKNGLRINGKALTVTGVTVYGTRNAIIGKTTVPHTLTNAYWSPVSLPYAMDAAQISEVFGEGTQVAQLGTCVKNDGTKKVSITMESVDAIEPCKPYLIKAGNKGSNYLFAGAQLFNSRFTRASATDANNLVTFVSTAPDYSGAEPKDETTLPVGAWYFNGGKIYKASKEWPIASGLAYFTLNATLQSKGSTLMFGGDEVTGIETVVTGETDVKTSYIYNVNGQNVGTDLNALPSGIYIVNGRKIVK